MTQTDEVSSGSGLIQTRIMRAQNELSANELGKAAEFFKNALDVNGNHPERAAQIRRVLIEYSDETAARQPPDWKCAHEALEMLNPESLNLHDEETLTRQRKLKFDEARYWLQHKDLDKSFDIYAKLMAKVAEAETQNELFEISRRLRDYVLERLPDREWLLLSDIIERLNALRPAADEVHDWLVTSANILKTTDQAQSEHQQARVSLEKVITDRELTIQDLNQALAKAQTKQQELAETISTQVQRIEQQTQEVKRYRNLVIALAIAIAILLIVAYAPSVYSLLNG